MRVVSDDGREVIATSEALTSVAALSSVCLMDAQHLNLSFNALTSLHGLHEATQLRNLNVSHNGIVSLRGVETFQHLCLLRCSGNRISDLSWLASLPHLCELWVNDNSIETPQIAHLASLRSLATLVLHPNPCTNGVNYVSYVVKAMPWLSRVDLVVVDDALRQQSHHVDERAFLSSAATDVSEISLMTSRSDNDTLLEGPEDVDPTQAGQVQVLPKAKSDLGDQTQPASALVSVEKKSLKKKTKKMTAEDFMRAFPVQDFIPAMSEGSNTSEDDWHSSVEPTHNGSSSVLPVETAVRHDGAITEEQPMSNQDEHSIDKPQAIYQDTMLSRTSTAQEPLQVSSTPISAIASAVLPLPLFKDDGILQKKKTPAAVAVTRPKKPVKSKQTPSKPTGNAPPRDPELASFQQQEYIGLYPNSTVAAIQVRADGSALAKWPNGTVAVSVDRERGGFRCYAAHKDGTIALSVDADGVGFINYYPSGRMMISTSSSGDGLYFSNEGTIVRQWDAQLNLKNEKWQATDTLSDSESDGSLLVKLSDGLAIRLELKSADTRTGGSAIDLTVFFNSGTGLRHAYRNWINTSEPNGSACDVAFGKEIPKLKKKASSTRTHTHGDTLHDIRAAVAKLQ